MAEQNNRRNSEESEHQRNAFNFEQVYSPYVFSPFQQPLFQQEELIQSFTPLMSPVSTPTVSFHQLSLRNGEPSQMDEFEFLAPSATMDQTNQNTQFNAQFAPMTPSQLMQMNREQPRRKDSSRSSSRGSSGNLKPLLPVTPTMRPEDADLLALKSNYQTVMEGYGDNFGIGNGMQAPVKKVSHKEAEQKRRDNLKNHFKIVRQVLPLSRNKNPSKVVILKKARKHILDLEFEKRQMELHLESLQQHIKQLETLLTDQGIQPPKIPVFQYQNRPNDVECNSSEED